MRPLVRLALAVVVVSTAFFAFHIRHRDPAPPVLVEASMAGPWTAAMDAARPAVPEPPPLRFERALIRRGETLNGTLGRLGLSPGERAPLIRALRERVDPRRLPGGTGLAVARRAGTGEIVAVSCRTEARRFVRARRDGTGAWRAEHVDLPVRADLETAGGVVSVSLAQALADEPHGTKLTHAVADIFQWDIDLLVDPRPGDEIRLVYEVHRLDEVPEDLPPLRREELPEAGVVLGLGRVVAASYDGSTVSSAAYWVESPSGRTGYYDDEGQPLQKTFLRSPLNYTRISSGFSRARRHPVTRRVVPHHGVDFVAPHGTPVVATADGRVAAVGWQGALGRAVRLRHGNGYETIYGHLSRWASGIAPGTQVRQNQVIGYVGATGRATGTHLHYTLKHHGRAIDPQRFKSPPADPLDRGDLDGLARARERWTPLLSAIRLADPSVVTAAAGGGGERAGAGREI